MHFRISNFNLLTARASQQLLRILYMCAQPSAELHSRDIYFGSKHQYPPHFLLLFWKLCTNLLWDAKWRSSAVTTFHCMDIYCADSCRLDSSPPDMTRATGRLSTRRARRPAPPAFPSPFWPARPSQTNVLHTYTPLPKHLCTLCILYLYIVLIKWRELSLWIVHL